MTEETKAGKEIITVERCPECKLNGVFSEQGFYWRVLHAQPDSSRLGNDPCELAKLRTSWVNDQDTAVKQWNTLMEDSAKSEADHHDKDLEALRLGMALACPADGPALAAVASMGKDEHLDGMDPK